MTNAIGETVKNRKIDAVVAGVPFGFDRRRYGRQTFTWAFALVGGEWLSCGDPWPGVKWPKKELATIASAFALVSWNGTRYAG